MVRVGSCFPFFKWQWHHTSIWFEARTVGLGCEWFDGKPHRCKFEDRGECSFGEPSRGALERGMGKYGENMGGIFQVPRSGTPKFYHDCQEQELVTLEEFVEMQVPIGLGASINDHLTLVQIHLWSITNNTSFQDMMIAWIHFFTLHVEWCMLKFVQTEKTLSEIRRKDMCDPPPTFWWPKMLRLKMLWTMLGLEANRLNQSWSNSPRPSQSSWAV